MSQSENNLNTQTNLNQITGILDRAGINNDHNQNAINLSDIDDGFILFGVASLEEAYLLNQANFQVLFSYPRRIMHIARVLIWLEKANLLNMSNRLAVSAGAQYAIEMNSALGRLPANLINQSNLHAILSCPAQSMYVVDLLTLLNEANLLNDQNRNTIVALGENAEKLYRAFMFSVSVLTQEIFDASVANAEHASEIICIIQSLHIFGLSTPENCNALFQLFTMMKHYDRFQLDSVLCMPLSGCTTQKELDEFFIKTIFEHVFYVLIQGTTFYRKPDSTAFHGLTVDPYICKLILEELMSDVLDRKLTASDTKNIDDNLHRTIEYMRSVRNFKKSSTLFFNLSNDHPFHTYTRTAVIDSMIACKNANGGDPVAQELFDKQWGLRII